MAKRKSILVEIFGRDKLTSKLGKLTAKMNKIGAKMKNIGRNMSMRLTLPILALGVISTATFARFDDSMRKTQAVSGATGQQFQEMTALAKEMGRTTRFTASESAEAMSFLGLAGLKTNKIMQALPGTLELAAAGGIQLSEAAQIATGVMAAMKIPVAELGRVNDVLAFTQANATTNTLELAEALEPVAGTARSMGISLEELNATLGQLAKVNTRGSKAGRQLMNAYLEFAKKTGRPLSEFTQFIDELNEKNIKATTVMRVFGKIGGKAMVGLMAEGGGAIRQFTKELENSQGAAKRMAITMESGIGGTMRRTKSAIEGVAITIGETLQPMIERMAGFITRATEKFQALNPETQRLILIILGLTAAIGPALVVLGTLIQLVALLKLHFIATAVAIATFKIALIALKGAIIAVKAVWLALNIAFAISPIGAIITGVVLLVAAGILLYKNWKKIVQVFKDAFGKIKSMIGLIGKLKAVAGFFKGLFEGSPAGAAGVGAAARESTINKNVTSTSKVKMEFGNVPPGTTIKSEGGGNDLDMIVRGASLAAP